MTVVRTPSRGKAAALNTGVLRASHEIVVMLDADTVFEPSTVRRLVEPFADPSVGATAGNAKVGNRHGMLGRWQHIEYVMGFNLDRRMYDLLSCMPTVPGAVGAFRVTALRRAGMMSGDTLAEDTDITMALHRAGWDVRYAEHAVAWTEARGRCGSCGASGTAGATASCRPRGSTGTRSSSRVTPDGSGGSGCRCWRCSRSSRRCSPR